MSNVYSGKDLLLNVKGSVSVIFCFIFRVSDSADLLFLLYTLIEISFCHTAGKFLILLFISVVNCRDLFGYSIGVLYSIGFQQTVIQCSGFHDTLQKNHLNKHSLHYITQIDVNFGYDLCTDVTLLTRKHTIVLAMCSLTSNCFKCKVERENNFHV